MKLLLDTHTFIWLDTSPERLSSGALAVCEEPTNQLYLSVVSAWEIQIKAQLGRLTLDISLDQMIDKQRADNGLRILSVELHHVYLLNDLPYLHSDPFDRLLIAQANAERAQLVSADSQFQGYPVEVIW